jgi:plastocyanin
MLSFSAMKTAVHLLGFLLCLAPPASPATLTVQLNDAAGAALGDAVAWATPRAPLPAATPRPGAVAQVDKTFVPLVTVVQAGAQVAFPNRDEIRHHVYSFSPARVFEIKLYADVPVPPRILFDKPGEVVLGCNIHDNMLGYILVVDSPYYGKSGADGRVTLENLPEGEYELHAWHPSQAAPPEARPLRLKADDNATASYSVALRPRPRPPPR